MKNLKVKVDGGLLYEVGRVFDKQRALPSDILSVLITLLLRFGDHFGKHIEIYVNGEKVEKTDPQKSGIIV